MDIEQIKADREAGTPGPWSGHNMVHADRGDQMTPEEIGEYVANSVRMGDQNRFLFVSGKHDDGGDCDVCHTGNGPRGAANTRRIARVPELEAAVIAQTALIAELFEALEFIENKVSWEINPSNYDHQQVCDMNADWVEIGNTAIDALDKAKAAQ